MVDVIRLKRTVPPELQIVSLEDMRTHLRIDTTEEDSYVQALVDAAVAHLDGYKGVLGWCLGEQTWQYALDAFPDGAIRLPIGPLLAVESVEYANQGDAYVTLDPREYVVDTIADPGWIAPAAGWPSVSGVNAVVITFRAGHETLGEIHAAIPVIVKLLAAHWYQNREAVSESMAAVPMSAEALIGAHRRYPT